MVFSGAMERKDSIVTSNILAAKHLFSRSLAADPGRLHFAAHSHHLWPDAAFDGANEALDDAARLADLKWGRALGEVAPALAASIAEEIGLSSGNTISFAPNTHEFLLRIASCFATDRPLRILTSDGEFHAFARQVQRWEEAGEAQVTRLPVSPAGTLAARFAGALADGRFDWCFVSQVFFSSGQQWMDDKALAHLANASEQSRTHLTLDGYHGYMAVPTDLSGVAGTISYLSGGYKYAMAGENACFLHMPDGVFPRPVNTGWFAAFDDLASSDMGVTYAPGGARFAGSTFDPIGLYRALRVREKLQLEGITTALICDHTRALQDQFLRALKAGKAGPLGHAELVTPLEPAYRARFLAFRHSESARWQAALIAQNIITDVRSDVIRIGFGLYQDQEDVARLVAALGALG
jgi:selenocysteine lyase/cysteine desulfurase